jgi:hypothetical protein
MKIGHFESGSETSGKILNVVLVKDGEDQLRADRVRNEEVLHRVKEEKNILHTIKEGKQPVLVIYNVGTAFCNTLLKER